MVIFIITVKGIKYAKQHAKAQQPGSSLQQVKVIIRTNLVHVYVRTYMFAYVRTVHI